MAQSKNDRNEVADFQTQLESLLDTVWRGERMWKLEDRMNLQVEADRSPEPRARPAPRMKHPCDRGGELVDAGHFSTTRQVVLRGHPPAPSIPLSLCPGTSQ